ncbi:MAG TPA: hypothetical protein VH120_02485 [Gemmataceae bacterium]|jgi:hypothetical protein|nr:hypothetical protein [Gemmataceae bacterium]
MSSPVADRSPLANAYLLGGLAAIFILAGLLLQTSGRWGLVPAMLGAAGLAFHWRSAPLLVMAAIALGQIAPLSLDDLPWFRVPQLFPRQTVLPSRLVIHVGVCAATLAYVIAQYRLIGLTVGLLPAEVRKGNPPREAAAGSAELGGALFTVSAVTIGGFLLWRAIGVLRPWWGIEPAHWRLGLLAWLLIGGTAVTAAVLGHLGWRRLSRVEAAIYLQDGLWHETRREQRRINRWRAWGVRRR